MLHHFSHPAMRDKAQYVLECFKQRESADHPTVAAMREVQQAADGDVIIPLPEMDKDEKPAVANLVGEAIEQTAIRVAGTMPNLFCPPMDPRKKTGKRSEEWADIRRRAISGWWEQSRINRINRRRARFLVGYGLSVVQVKPNFKTGMPQWVLRDPLQTFPNPTAYYDDSHPVDVVFAYTKPLGWLQQMYPEQAARLWKGNDPTPTTMVDIIEFVDADCFCLVAVPSKEQPNHALAQAAFEAGNHPLMLEHGKNRLGRCNVVAPKRITLHKVAGQFNQILGMYFQQAKLMALDLIAVEKAIFPDLAIVGDNGQPPQLLGDVWRDGRTGDVNIIHNGKPELVQLNPGYKTGEALDRLERAQRMHGVSPEWGGENPTNVRTGRGAEVVMSAQLDHRILEYQEGLAESLEYENKLAVAVDKTYFGNREKTFYVGFRAAKGSLTYTPNVHFETDENKVSYPMPGADVNQAIIGVGQRVGMNMMSRETGMYIDPLIEDPELEIDRIKKQRLEDSLMDAISMMASQGSIPPADLALIMKFVMQDNLDLADAVQKAQEEVQKRQAQQVEATDPAAQPGLAEPGMGAEAGVAIPEVGEGARRFQELMFQLRQPQTPAGGAPPEVFAGAGA